MKPAPDPRTQKCLDWQPGDDQHTDPGDVILFYYLKYYYKNMFIITVIITI